MDKVTLILHAEEEMGETPQELEGLIHMRAFYHATEKGETPPQETMLFIARAFRRIDQEKTKPEQALKLTKKRGRSTDYKKELANAEKVRRLILQGRGQDDAINEVAKDPSRFKTVRRHYHKHKKTAGMMLTQKGITESYSHIFTGGISGVIKKKPECTKE